jgi:hypothetical protein
MNKVKLPFDCMILDTEPVSKNRFLLGVMLTPKLLLYMIPSLVSEMIRDYKSVRKGLDWFRKYFPEMTWYC